MDLPILCDCTADDFHYISLGMYAGLFIGMMWRDVVYFLFKSLTHNEPDENDESNDSAEDENEEDENKEGENEECEDEIEEEDTSNENYSRNIAKLNKIVLEHSRTMQKLMDIVESRIKKSNTSDTPSTEQKINTDVKPTETPDEIAMMFEDEHQRQSRNIQQTLDIGRNIGTEPVKYYAKRGGGYATLSELNETREEAEKFKEKRLSRADELDIMHTFSGIRGMRYTDAFDAVRYQGGYTLHPIYINSGPKNPAHTYSGTTIGVSVSDPNYNPLLPCPEGLSRQAIVTSIVDVGGQDVHNRGGKIKLADKDTTLT